jgi:arylsulfatase A-like enzyme
MQSAVHRSTAFAAAIAVAAAVLFARDSSAANPPAAKPPNVLLIVLDTLRFDATSLGDPASGNTPFLASLAARGVVFTKAYSSHDFTPPSHFTILTGLADGLGTKDDRRDVGVPYQLHRAGYDTFATVANSLLSPRQMPVLDFATIKEVGDVNGGSRIDQTDDLTAVDERLGVFGLRPTIHNRAMLYFDANRLLPIFRDQIRAAHRPFFGFVNLVDPHEPYVPDPATYPPEPDRPARFQSDVLQRTLSAELREPDAIVDAKRRSYIKERIAVAGSPKLVSTDLSPQALAIYQRRYRASVQQLDHSLREFFALLQRDGVLDDTIVIITSDHGESFGEADLITHNFHDRGDYESTHHVPLLIVLPPSMTPKTHVVDRRVSIGNLAPTIYELTGVDAAPLRARYRGYPASLASLLTDAHQKTRTAVALNATAAAEDSKGAGDEHRRALQSLGYVQ